MTKNETTNTFNEGMIMDLNPMVTPNNVLTRCLNGTIITYNGNENVLQNDMGNGRVETAYLPEGYVPLGTAELGGIIYIVSYNPLVDKCQIGSFPSPERNITTDELGESSKMLKLSEFYLDGKIMMPMKKLMLMDKILHPGDKFQIGCSLLKKPYDGVVSAQESGNVNPDLFPKYLKLNVVAVQDNGKMVNLNKTLVWNGDNDFYIHPAELTASNGKLDLDEYRGLVKSNYSVFNSKVDGKLAVLAQLECIDTFDVSWDAIKNDDGGWDFYFFLNWSYNNDVDNNKVNLYGIRVECDKGTLKDFVIKDYPKSGSAGDNDILNNKNTIFYTPPYIDEIKDPGYSGNANQPLRKNDGTDNQYLLFQAYSIPTGSEGTANFTVWPAMPFGYLEYLKQSFSVNLDKLGTGDIDLKEYRYYWSKDNLTLNWGLDAYPERNKQITEVKFNFYKYDNTIHTFSSNNAVNIDESRVIVAGGGSAWDGGSTVSPLSGAAHSLKTPTKSSYSGNFTETITGLENDQLYLVEIEINYNNAEKVIKYYRYLYTSNIFNDYYFSESDFSKIALSDAIAEYHPVLHNPSNSTQSLNDLNTKLMEELTGGSTEKEGAIPNNVGSSMTSNYTVDTSYEYSLSFEIQGEIKSNPIFDVNFSEINISDSSLEVRQNAESASIQSSGDSRKTTFERNVEDDATLNNPQFTGNTFSGVAKIELKTPLQVQYLQLQQVAIPLKLSEVVVEDAWVLFDGGSKWINIYFTDSYLRAENVSSNDKDEFGDDVTEIGLMSKYVNTYQAIKNRLKNIDVLALKVRMHHDAKSGKEDKYTVWAKGAFHGGDRPGGEKNLYFPAGNQTTSGVAIVYAALDTNDDVVFFTFGTGSAYFDRSWHGVLTMEKVDSDSQWTGSLPISFKSNSITSALLAKPFKIYYKVLENNTSLSVYPWSRINYYENYPWSGTINLQCSANMQIQINGVDIPDSNMPKNLSYIKNVPVSVTLVVSGLERFDAYLDMLLQQSTQNNLVLMPDGSSKVIDGISTRKIYNGEGSYLEFLKQDNGSADVSMSNYNTNFKISAQNDHMYIKAGNVTTDKTLMIIGRQEEQSITVKNILQLN